MARPKPGDLTLALALAWILVWLCLIALSSAPEAEGAEVARGQYRELIHSMVRDDVGAISDDDCLDALDHAFAHYSRLRPRRLVAELAAAADGIVTQDIETDLAGWDAGLSCVTGVEHPIGEIPPIYLDHETYAAPDALVLYAYDVASGDTARVAYTAAHTYTVDSSTAPALDQEAIASWAAARLLEELAARGAGVTDSAIGADGIDHNHQVRDYAAIAKGYRNRFYELLGIDRRDEMRTPGAGAVAQLERRRLSTGTPRLTHRRRLGLYETGSDPWGATPSRARPSTSSRPRPSPRAPRIRCSAAATTRSSSTSTRRARSTRTPCAACRARVPRACCRPRRRATPGRAPSSGSRDRSSGRGRLDCRAPLRSRRSSNGLSLGGLGLGAGGSGLSLGPATNTFGDRSTADRAAAVALRDAYQAANAAWLALYSANRSFYILLRWGDGEALQRRNAAGDAWEDATGLIAGPKGNDGAGLSPGTEAQNEVRWNTANGRWEAVSTVQTSWVALTREATYLDLETLMLAVANEPGGVGSTDVGVLRSANGSATVSDLAVFSAGADNLPAATGWPVGQAAPYAWIILPQYYGWLGGFTVNAGRERPDSDPLGYERLERISGTALVRAPWLAIVDGTPYEVGYAQIPVQRPAGNEWVSVSFGYTAPPDAGRTVTQQI